MKTKVVQNINTFRHSWFPALSVSFSNSWCRKRLVKTFAEIFSLLHTGHRWQKGTKAMSRGGEMQLSLGCFLRPCSGDCRKAVRGGGGSLNDNGNSLWSKKNKKITNSKFATAKILIAKVQHRKFTKYKKFQWKKFRWKKFYMIEETN